MSTQMQPRDSFNPWKWTTLGIMVILATALITGVVVAKYAGKADTPESQQLAAVPPPAPGVAVQQAAPPPPHKVVERHASAKPSSAVIDECNRVASSTRDKTRETIKDALIGGAAGAGLGAAGGAIANGGNGAGKGAGIGGLVGAAAGTLYGLNENNQSDVHVAQAYRDCMRQHGYPE